MIMEDCRNGGIRLGTDADRNLVTRNVICFNEAAGAADNSGVRMLDSSNNTISHNIVLECNDKNIGVESEGDGYAILLQHNADNNLVQGNLMTNSAGKNIFRILRGGRQAHVVRGGNNIIRDNIIAYSNGPCGNNDCLHHQNQFINNFIYSLWFHNMMTKGNQGGGVGLHLFTNNTFVMTNNSRMGVSEIGGGCGGETRDDTYKNNIYYSPDKTMNGGSIVIVELE